MAFVIAVLVVAAFHSQAEEPWITVKDLAGRELSVQIQNVEGDKVTFKTKNGKTYTYDIKKFSGNDQLRLKKWKPATVNPVIKDAELKRTGTSQNSTTYQTKHFEFEVLGGEPDFDKLKEVAVVCEATYWGFENLPLNLTPKPQDSHFKAQFFVKDSDFEISAQETLAEGQPAVYNLGDDLIKAPMSKLEANAGLVREVAFALLGKRLESFPPWLSVALSEYIASAPFENKRLKFDDPFANMTSYLESAYEISGRNLLMLNPDKILELNYPTLRSQALEGSKSRSSALMLFHFFAHLDGKGDGGALRDYGLAIRTNSEPDKAVETLLGSRDLAKLKDDIKVAFVPKKVRVAFIE